jgi:signal transduction histidine kinase
MDESVIRMQRLLDRLRTGNVHPRDQTTDFARLIGDELRTRFSGSESVLLELDQDSVLPIVADPDRLVAISGHLISNAIEAAGPDGHVTVRLRREGSESLFEVVDDGPGMTPEVVERHLSHPFQSSGDGYGIGLYECRALATELGGELVIESTPGRGTVARLRVPLARGNSLHLDSGARHA